MPLTRAMLAASLLAMPALLAGQTPAPDTTAPTVHPRVGNEIELGRKYTAWFQASQFDSLWAHMSQEMRDNLGEPAAMAQAHEQIASRAGEELKVLDEMVMMRNGEPQYWRTSEYSMMAEPLMLRWVIVNGEIWGIGINPASQAPPTDPEQ
jgi:hypothetical protein